LQNQLGKKQYRGEMKKAYFQHIPATEGERADIEEFKSFVEETHKERILKSTHQLEEKIREKASSLMNKEGLTMEEALSRLQIVFKEGEEPDVVMK
jgi:biopolymer transport protein ExbB/TolQ